MEEKNGALRLDSLQDVEEWLTHQRRRINEIVIRQRELAATEAQLRAEWEVLHRQWEDEQ